MPHIRLWCDTTALGTPRLRRFHTCGEDRLNAAKADDQEGRNERCDHVEPS